MANSFFISVKPEIAAVQTVVDANSVILVDVHDTDLPAVKTDIGTNLTGIGANNTILADLHDTDLPGAVTKIDDVKTVVDAVKLKTDATPQPIRGKMLHAQLTTTSATLQDVVNVTGHGKLDQVSILLANSADTIEIVITLDGVAFTAFTYTGDTVCQFIYPSVSQPSNSAKLLNRDPYLVESVPHFNIEFQASLLVQARRSIGSAGNVYAKVHYTEDQF